MTEKLPTDFTVGQRVLVDCDRGPKAGVVKSIGRKYVQVHIFGVRRACYPWELTPL